MKTLIKKIRIRSCLVAKTGLHIGGSKDSVEIGGIDIPVIKAALKKDQPYIPGSSIKGKMRCLLEQTAGATKIGGDDKVNNLFGFAENNKPSKIIIRDAYLTQESEEELRKCEFLDMVYTENKYENSIDRLKGTAENPRQIERVPAGAKFNVEIIINVWDDDNEKDLKEMVYEGIRLIECDYIGGNGSRGYGQVVFECIKETELSSENKWSE